MDFTNTEGGVCNPNIIQIGVPVTSHYQLINYQFIGTKFSGINIIGSDLLYIYYYIYLYIDRYGTEAYNIVEYYAQRYNYKIYAEYRMANNSVGEATNAITLIKSRAEMKKTLTISLLEPEYFKTYLELLDTLNITSEDYPHIFFNLNPYYIETLPDSVIGHYFAGHFINEDEPSENLTRIHQSIEDMLLYDMTITSQGLLVSIIPSILIQVVGSTKSYAIETVTQYIFICY